MNGGSGLGSVVEQDFVELGPFHLVGKRLVRVDLIKFDGPWGSGSSPHIGCALFLSEPGRLDGS